MALWLSELVHIWIAYFGLVYRYTGGGTQIRSLSLPKEERPKKERRFCLCLVSVLLFLLFVQVPLAGVVTSETTDQCVVTRGVHPTVPVFPTTCLNLKMKLSLDSSLSNL